MFLNHNGGLLCFEKFLRLIAKRFLRRSLTWQNMQNHHLLTQETLIMNITLLS